MSGEPGGLLRRAARGVLSCAEGLAVTFRYLVHLPGPFRPTTIRYDGTRETRSTLDLAPRFRGHLYNDVARCIACGACVRACPLDVIWLETERDENDKLRPSRYDVDAARCMVCALCVPVCPTDCLTTSPVFEIEGEHRGRRLLARVRREELSRRLAPGEEYREDPDGDSLVARYGLGFYPPEEAARVAAAREEKKRKKAGAATAAKAAKAKAEPGGAEGPPSGPAPGASGAPPAPGGQG